LRRGIIRLTPSFRTELFLRQDGSATAILKQALSKFDPLRIMIIKKTLLIMTALLCIFVFCQVYRTHTKSPYLFVGDGYWYYVYLPSFIKHGNLDFTNEYTSFPDRAYKPPPLRMKWGQPSSNTGRPQNVFAIGSAVLWAPFYITGFYSQWLIQGVKPNGFEPLCEWFTIMGGFFWSCIGLYLLWNILCKLQSRFDKLLIIIGSLIGTPLGFYMFLAPHMSHGTEFFASTAHIWALHRLLNNANKIKRILIIDLLLVGSTLGLLLIVRWQTVTILFLTFFVLLSLFLEHKLKLWRFFFSCSAILISSLPFILMQVMAWQYIYGKPFLIPQGNSYLDFQHPQIMQLLFGSRHGLLLWTPLFAVGIFGLLIDIRRDNSINLILGSFLTIASSIYVSSVVSDYWCTQSFGLRRLVFLVPLISIGLSQLLNGSNKNKLVATRIAILLCSMWSFYLLIKVTILPMLPPHGKGWTLL
jgi:hypothetical protein